MVFDICEQKAFLFCYSLPLSIAKNICLKENQQKLIVSCG